MTSTALVVCDLQKNIYIIKNEHTKEFDAIAGAKKIPYFYDMTKRDLMLKLNFIQSADTVSNNKSQNIPRATLNQLAKEMGGINNISKYDLAEKLGIELPRPKRKQPIGKACRKPRSVLVWNPNGTTTTTYPSINKAAQALRRPAMQLYNLAKSGEVKIN